MNSQSEFEKSAELLGRALLALEQELDWEALGQAYCEEGGEGFLDEEERGRWIETGTLFAQDLAHALTPNGASLYVGASLFEIVPALFEVLCLGRRVVLLNLDGFESRELNRGLDAASRAIDRDLPSIQFVAPSQLSERGFDHLWMTSVLNDPEAFPALHDELYERREGEWATGRGDLEEDRKNASALLEALLPVVTDTFSWTTTDEELPVIEPWLSAKGRASQRSETARLSAFVGDPVRRLYVSLA